MLTRTIKNLTHRFFPPEHIYTGMARGVRGTEYKFSVVGIDFDTACAAANAMGLTRIVYMNRGERVNGLFSKINFGHRERLQGIA